MIQSRHAALEGRIHEGVFDPFDEVRAAHREIAPELAALKNLSETLLRPNLTTERRETLSRELFTRLQPIAPWLSDAVSFPADATLTPTQYTEFQRLSNVDRGPGLPEDRSESLHQLRVVGPGTLYTLHFLTVPVTVQTDPGAEVFWEAPNGGRFENGLSLARTVADENGLTTLSWVSQGDATDTADVVITSPRFRDLRNVYIHVVDLIPGFLPETTPPSVPAPQVP